MDHAAAIHAGAHGGDDNASSFERARLGMWFFLASEIMMFGAFIAVYVVLRMANPIAFKPDYIHQFLSWKVGLFNTAVLIVSSFTMVMAVHAIRRNNRGRCAALVAATAALGIVFLVVKIVLEYMHDFHLGIGPNTSVFWSCYFFLTGFHGLHVLIGVIYLFGLIPFMKKFSAERHAHVELGGLYWHLVDVIWIFIFPLLYLIPLTK
jgi:cytochrome c oxidase subunit 3